MLRAVLAERYATAVGIPDLGHPFGMDPESFIKNESCAPWSVERPEVRKIMRGDGEDRRRGMNVAVKTWVLATLTL